MNGLKGNSPSSFGTPDPVLEKTDPTLVVPSMWPRPCPSPSTVPSPVKTGDVLSTDPGVSSKMQVVSGTPDGVVSGVVSTPSTIDRKSVASGKRVSGRDTSAVCRHLKKK